MLDVTRRLVLAEQHLIVHDSLDPDLCGFEEVMAGCLVRVLDDRHLHVEQFENLFLLLERHVRQALMGPFCEFPPLPDLRGRVLRFRPPRSLRAHSRF